MRISAQTAQIFLPNGVLIFSDIQEIFREVSNSDSGRVYRDGVSERDGRCTVSYDDCYDEYDDEFDDEYDEDGEDELVEEDEPENDPTCADYYKEMMQNADAGENDGRTFALSHRHAQ